MIPSPQFQQITYKLQQRQPGAPEEMIALAGSGDPDACCMVSEFRLLGLHCEQDLKEAFRLAARAAKSGHEEGRRTHAYFTAKGIGTRPDWDKAVKMLRKIAPVDRFAAVQLAFLEHLTCDSKLKTARRTRVSDDPYIEVVHELFSPAECRYIQVLGTPWLQPAMIVNEAGEGMLHPQRDSDTAAIAPVAEDLVTQRINACIAKASGTKTAWGEPLTILRYGPGQQYRPHHDAYEQQHRGAVRQKTAMIWLNQDYEGGETHFPNLGLKVRGTLGDMIIWDNLTANGKPDPRMLHAGLPVTKRIKWLATRWIRASNYLDAPS